jgi:hypothetical protein
LFHTLKKKIAAALMTMITFAKGRTIVALFTIVIASSLIIISGFTGSAYAHTANKVKQHQYGLVLSVPFSGPPEVLAKDKSSMSRTSHSANAGNSGWNIGDTSSIPTKEIYMWRKICNT